MTCLGRLTGQKNERPVGVPAARGHGVMEVQLEASAASGGAGHFAESRARLGVCRRPRAASMGRRVYSHQYQRTGARLTPPETLPAGTTAVAFQPPRAARC